MTLSKQDLRKLQLIQLDMLKEVDRICKKYNIKYCIIAGTILGAVRHEGYIPWDDDADVAMLRSEYERFRQACEEELNRELYYFQDHNNTPGYRWGYGKLRRKDTAFIRLGQEHMPYDSGVFIDIFPLDGVPQKKINRGIHNFSCYTIRKFMWARVGCVSEKHIIKRYMFKFMNLMPEKWVFGMYAKLINISNRGGSEYVRILTFPTPRKRMYAYKRKWYAELCEIEFEGYTFPAPKDWDEYLTFKFGDYMVLPPKHLQKTHPVSFYSLEVSEDR